MAAPTNWFQFAKFSEWTDAQIVDAVRLKGVVNAKLASCNPLFARAELRATLAGVYIPSGQVVSNMRTCLAMLENHARANYCDQHTYRLMINSRHWEREVVRPLCLTGLPGIGKTALCEGLMRLMDRKPVVEVGTGYAPTSFQLARHVKVTAANSIVDILKQVVFGNSDQTGSFTFKDLTRVGARTAYRDGLLLAILDEMQLVARAENASANVVKLLLAAVDLRIPVIHTSNFINVSKIMRSGMEVTDRLMVNSLVMTPEQSNDPAEFELREAYEAVSGGAVRNEGAVWSALNEITLRIHRTRIDLLCLAFERARNAGRSRVSLEDVLHAAQSADFAVSRASLVALSSMAISGRPVVGRKDLLCPLGVHLAFPAAAKQELERFQKAAVEEIAVLSSLTPHERRGLAKIQQEQTLSTSPKPKKKVPRATYEALLESATLSSR